MYALINCTIYTNRSVLTGHALLIDNNKIDRIIPIDSLDEQINSIDLDGANVCPGFIDLQLNGCGGVMFNGNVCEQTLAIMQATNLAAGCTSYLPTLITSSNEEMRSAIQVVRNYMENNVNQVLGLHLEGPFLSLAKKGIHRAEYIREPQQQMVDFICDNADIVTTITVAPESVAPAVIKQFCDAGIVVSLGHSNASYAQASTAVECGASCATHLFNAMSPQTGREPGMVGAIYDHQLYAGIIVDGFHVDYANVRIAKKLLADKLFLVTDATAAAGSSIEHFDFVGTTVYYQQGKCVGQDGTLGGSAITMIEAIANSVNHVGIELAEAIRMASLYPARAIAVEDKLATVEPGKIANLAIFSDDFKVLGTVVNGQLNGVGSIARDPDNKL